MNLTRSLPSETRDYVVVWNGTLDRGVRIDPDVVARENGYDRRQTPKRDALAASLDATWREVTFIAAACGVAKTTVYSGLQDLAAMGRIEARTVRNQRTGRLTWFYRRKAS